jgi:precorrin-2 dehydrogenase/sirohydrochlorin ferrochelatase
MSGEMGYYPVFLEMKDRPCVVVGGGAVAERKVEGLLAVGARVTVVSPELTPALAALKAKGRLHHVDRPYREGDLDGHDLAVVATDDGAVNADVAREGRRLGVWVNAVDDPENCDFILPSVIRRGDVTIAASTGGASPALARHLREELEAFLSEEYGPLAELLREVRQELRLRGITADPETWQRAIDRPLRALIAQRRMDQARAHLLASLGAEAPTAPTSDSER